MDGKKNSNDITRIEDLPNLDQHDDQEEDFQDLESMANELGLENDEQFSGTQPDKQTENNEFTTSNSFTSLDEENEIFPSEVNEESLADNQHDEAEADYSSEFTSDFNNDFESGLSDNSESDFSDEFESDVISDISTESEMESSLTDRDDHKSVFFNDDLDIKNEKAESNLNNAEISFISQDISNEATQKDSTVNEPPKQDSYKSAENFSEVTSFIENNAYGDFTAEGNPPFSIIIKNCKFYEDVQDIINILIDVKIYDEKMREELKKNLERGQLLISRLSEYAAIILCHKLRGFDLEILMGLTEEINPPKSYHSNDRGLTSKRSLLNNKDLYHRLKDRGKGVQGNILTSTLPTIDGHRIVKNLGLITHAKILNLDDIKGDIEEELIENSAIENKSSLRELQLARENNLSLGSTSIDNIEQQFSEDITGRNMSQGIKKQSHNLNMTYENIVNELIQKVDQKIVNGILGINFTITPINIDDYLSNGPKYQVICSGNMVCLEKI